MRVELIHANCLEWLRQQPTSSVAAIVSDPPYHVQGRDDLTVFLNDVLLHCLRIARGPVVWVMPLQWEFEKQMARRAPAKFNPKPDDIGLWLTFHGKKLVDPKNPNAREGSRGAAPIYTWRGPSMGSFEIPLTPEVDELSTVKPVGLFTRIVKKMPTGTIVDPFAGYGTCGEACKALGRPFIGIENDARVAETAAKRLGMTRRDVQT